MLAAGLPDTQACSVVYYVDEATGKIYVANNEDYWYDVKSYIQVMPTTKGEFARLWYGWDHFAQGGINDAGLFFDGAVTPEQEVPAGYSGPKGNLGDDILAACRTVDEAVAFLEQKKVALKNAHLMVGDKTGNAVVIEWVDGVKKIISIQNNTLVMTNFLLSDTTQENYPCPRYDAIEHALRALNEPPPPITFKDVGNTVANAVQLPTEDQQGREGGTLYSTFINISDGELILIPKLDNTKAIKIDLLKEFAARKKRKIKFG